jgi:hypothetical protein
LSCIRISGASAIILSCFRVSSVSRPTLIFSTASRSVAFNAAVWKSAVCDDGIANILRDLFSSWVPAATLG